MRNPTPELKRPFGLDYRANIAYDIFISLFMRYGTFPVAGPVFYAPGPPHRSTSTSGTIGKVYRGDNEIILIMSLDRIKWKNKDLNTITNFTFLDELEAWLRTNNMFYFDSGYSLEVLSVDKIQYGPYEFDQRADDRIRGLVEDPDEKYEEQKKKYEDKFGTGTYKTQVEDLIDEIGGWKEILEDEEDDDDVEDSVKGIITDD